MRLSCPGCSKTIEFDPGPQGRLHRCAACGTEWFARPFVQNPYAATGFRGVVEGIDGSKGRIIEHAPPGFDRRAAPAPSEPGWRSMLWSVGRVGFAGLAILAAVMIARVPIVAAFPDAADAAPLVRNDLLTFQKVRSEHSMGIGGERLVVEGELFNPTWNTLALPALEVVLMDDDGNEVRRWRVDLARSEIDGREAVGFRTALAAPPEGADSIRLVFAPRRAHPAQSS